MQRWIQKCNGLNNERKTKNDNKRKLGYVVPGVTGWQDGALCYTMEEIVLIVVKFSVYNDYML